MPRKNKLYQCPYERSCKCDMSLPCLGCETWAEHYGKFENSPASPVQQLKAEIATLALELDRAKDIHPGYSTVDRVIEKMRQLSAV